MANGRHDMIEARVLVNATGPWVARTLASCLGLSSKEHVHLARGSHIVVGRLFDHDRAYLLQNHDGRVVFAIPYQGTYTLIGTTDCHFSGDPTYVAPTSQEIAYLCDAASVYFARPIAPADVVWSFSGVRPLHGEHVGDPEEATRGYALELNAPSGQAALLSIFGGKITTYRRLAEAALKVLAPYLPRSARRRAGWTNGAALPGGDFPVDGLADLADALGREYPFLAPAHAARLAAAYGTRARVILAGARTAADLGHTFGATLTEAELRYLMAQEWAQSCEDVLWRRTKLGLAVTRDEADGIARFMASITAASAQDRIT